MISFRKQRTNYKTLKKFCNNVANNSNLDDWIDVFDQIRGALLDKYGYLTIEQAEYLLKQIDNKYYGSYTCIGVDDETGIEYLLTNGSRAMPRFERGEPKINCAWAKKHHLQEGLL